MARIKRLLLPGILVLAAYYAVFGGEYSYLEVRRVRQSLAVQATEMAELRRRIDSLQAWADSVETDPMTLERLARERFGMIKPGETLYRFVEEDTTARNDAGG